MKLANLAGRAVLVAADGRGIDVAAASQGRFGPTLPRVYDDWREFRAWADATGTPTGDLDLDPGRLGPPSPAPSQSIAIGLNYAEHAAETGFAVPDDLPPVFPNFQSALSGPVTTVDLPLGGHTDWEVEVVAIIGRTAHHIDERNAWDHVAGLTVGQDLSERVGQMSGPAPQFGLAKSHTGFAPTGPWLVTTDELDDPDDLVLGCSIDGETVQEGRTSRLIFGIPQIVARLSAVVTLRPGDVIFTGTPDGVGMGRNPQRFLASGEVLRTWVEGIGELEQTFR